MSLVRGIFGRAQDRQPLLPREAPSALQDFYREIGWLQHEAARRADFGAWLGSRWGWARLRDEMTPEEFEAEGRRLFRGLMTQALTAVPVAGPLVNAAHTEVQAALLWRAAQQVPTDPLRDTLETIALLKEHRAVAQAGTTPISLVNLVVALPFVASLGRLVAKQVVRRVTRALSDRIMRADRDALAAALHDSALADYQHDPQPPALTEANDPRHALYACVVLGVHLPALPTDTGRALVRRALD